MPYLLDSNYDRWLYTKWFWLPLDTDNPEDHPYGQRTPGPCPRRVSDITAK